VDDIREYTKYCEFVAKN